MNQDPNTNDFDQKYEQGNQQKFSTAFEYTFDRNNNGSSLREKINSRIPLWSYDSIDKTAVNKYDVDFGIETNFLCKKLFQE